MGLVSLLFSFNGRIKRSQYWLGTLGVNVVNWMMLFMSAGANLAAAQSKDPAAQLSALTSQSALMLPVSLAVTEGRLYRRPQLPRERRNVYERRPRGRPAEWARLRSVDQCTPRQTGAGRSVAP